MYTADAALLHDIGHEVATLSALVAAVRVEGELDAAAGERLELVEREIDLLLDLVGSGAATADDADALVDLRALLQDVVEAREAASATSVELLPGPRVLVRTDHRAVRRLVGNLVDNSARAAGPSGRVEVELDDTAGAARMRVLDDGPGPERGPGGARGMGLAIVRSLARGLAADVTLRPRRGGGAVAEVVLRDRDTSRTPVSGREARA